LQQLKTARMSNMNELVRNFPAQLKEALAIGEKAKLNKPSRPINNIVISGLGGSGIGGTIVAEIIAGEAKVPVVVIKDYFIPAFVNSNTLFICCSYSGNTEETVQALEDSLERQAMICCITSGGKIAEIAKSKNLDLVTIPGGLPPRACLGYSLTQLFFVLHAYGIIGNDFRQQIESSIVLLELEQKSIVSEAKELTNFFAGKIPVIYAVDGYNGVATRFRQQINENSKMLCWHNILPEMNHNELVGWAEKYDNVAVCILRNKTDYSRTQARIEISKTIFNKYTSHVTEVWSKGESHLEKALYLIHLTDHVSVMLADKKNIDATEVNVINHLKGQLAKI
jgi:glucose/mannose-6-phosphate isomerase